MDDPEKQPPISMDGGLTRTVRPQVALRFHDIQGHLVPWVGSVTAYTWPKVFGYGLYTTAIVLIFKTSCVEGKNDARCRFGQKKLQIELMVNLWMTFTAFLFQSFVNAAIASFGRTLASIRSIQGRFHEVSLLWHSHAMETDTSMATARRFLSALHYPMYSGPRFGGDRGRNCLAQVQSILEPEEFDILMERQQSDRPYVLLTWLNILAQTSIQSGTLVDTGGALALQLPRAIENLRGTLGGLVDSLDDPVLPFPFANLIIANVYTVSLLVPFISLEMLGYYMIPAAVIYFWFLDGMVTFVFFVHEPFLSTNKGSWMVKQPLIDIDRALLEMVAAVPRRFPQAVAKLPNSVSENGKEKES